MNLTEPKLVYDFIEARQHFSNDLKAPPIRCVHLSDCSERVCGTLHEAREFYQPPKAFDYEDYDY